MELSQLDRVYLSDLGNYNRVVNQRNRLLKDMKPGPDKSLMDTLEIWELQLIQYGNSIVERRKLFKQEVNENISYINKIFK